MFFGSRALRLLSCNKVDTGFFQRFASSLYQQKFSASIDKPEQFWGEAAKRITWFKPFDKVLNDADKIFPKWFEGGETNACFNAVDRHVDSGFGSQVAIYYDSPVTETKNQITFSELLDKVSKFAGVLTRLGVSAGDRVLIYMPMIPEAIVTMLACARIGAVHSLVFGGFASRELATRINHAKPKIVVSASYGVEPTRVVNYKPLLDTALEISDHVPQKCIIFQRPDMEKITLKKDRDLDWNDIIASAQPHDCVPLSANSILYILYTSGTTGDPKAVVRPLGGHIVNLIMTMNELYGVSPGDTFWAASDLGWVVGHSYICYGPLLNRNSSVLYEGKPVGTPDASAYSRVISSYKVKTLFTAPTAIRAIRTVDNDAVLTKKYPLSSLNNVYVAGEHLDKESLVWAKDVFKVPVIDHFWQTESGSPMLAIMSNGYGEDMNPPSGFSGKPVPGFNFEIINSKTLKATKATGEMGSIVVKSPLPPGFTDGLYGADGRQKYIDKYFKAFPGYYDTQDAGYWNEQGHIAVVSRIDDIINVAGHRLSTSLLEEVIAGHKMVAESAVIPVPDQVRGEVPFAVVVIKQGGSDSPTLLDELYELVRKEIGPVAALKQGIIVTKLPKTRSGKISRSSMKSLAAGKPFKIPPTIEDASVYDELKEKFQAIGLAKNAQ